MPAEPFNLLTAAWLPARRRSGRLDVIRPAQIAESLDDDPVLAIVWPRPDFRIAAIEFLIGLLSTFAPPADEEAWQDRWQTPPDPAALDAAFGPYAHAFALDGDGPRFLQDFDALDGTPNPAGTLLIEAPGANTLRNNADLLVKRGRVNVLSRAAAAMALFTLQTYAPSGGAGHRVGLRGGGPLTTLILPPGSDGAPAPLWRAVWAHVRPGKPVPLADLPRVLPWLAPTLTSEKNRTAIAAGLLPAHVFWGMPRRIRLVFEANAAGRPCDLTGTHDPEMVTGWRTRPYGLFYQDWSPPHPLSPRYRQKKTDPWLPVHGRPAGIGYRDWVGVVVAAEDGTREPAGALTWFRGNCPRADRQGGIRLLAAGYDMDNMKARGFVESEMPLPPPLDRDRAEALDDRIRRLVRAAGIADSLLRGAVRAALFSPGSKIDAAGASLLLAVRERFWRDAEAAFYARLRAAVAEIEADPDPPIEPLTRPWLKDLRSAALVGFDAAAPLDPDQYRERGGERPEQPVVRARGYLSAAFSGFGPGGRELFVMLGLSVREPARPAGKKPRSRA